MRAMALSLKHELIGLGGVVERNVYLTRRYIWWDFAFFLWTVANTLTIVFIAKGIEASGGSIDVEETTTALLIGAVVWAYLGIIFEFITETVAWERWEGTIEYTFMAPLSRAMHLGGSGVFAVLYGLVRASLLFVVGGAVLRPLAAGRELRRGARDPADRVGLVLRDRDDDRRAAADLAGEGGAARVRRAGPAARRLRRLLPRLGAAGVDAVGRRRSRPATYALRGIRGSILGGQGLLWANVWPLLVIGVVSIPLGLWVFSRGEIYAKRHGKLKRSG